jgi:hypothetical protein
MMTVAILAWDGGERPGRRISSVTRWGWRWAFMAGVVALLALDLGLGM